MQQNVCGPALMKTSSRESKHGNIFRSDFEGREEEFVCQVNVVFLGNGAVCVCVWGGGNQRDVWVTDR